MKSGGGGGGRTAASTGSLDLSKWTRSPGECRVNNSCADFLPDDYYISKYRFRWMTRKILLVREESWWSFTSGVETIRLNNRREEPIDLGIDCSVFCGSLREAFIGFIISIIQLPKQKIGATTPKRNRIQLRCDVRSVGARIKKFYPLISRVTSIISTVIPGQRPI